ncbi:hypothetical protein Trydic_g21748 [Trypoxylus dichotomus]
MESFFVWANHCTGSELDVVHVLGLDRGASRKANRHNLTDLFSSSTLFTPATMPGRRRTECFNWFSSPEWWGCGIFYWSHFLAGSWPKVTPFRCGTRGGIVTLSAKGGEKGGGGGGTPPPPY